MYSQIIVTLRLLEYTTQTVHVGHHVLSLLHYYQQKIEPIHKFSHNPTTVTGTHMIVQGLA